jgi:hypothetical protein
MQTDEQQLRSLIENSIENSQFGSPSKYRAEGASSLQKQMGDSGGQKMMATNFLKASGLLDGYEFVVGSLIEEGWPADSNIFDQAAYLLLKFHSEVQAAKRNA